MRVTMILPGHVLRPAAEDLIAEIYARFYGAQVDDFPTTLVGMVSADATILSAAGLRFAADGFFSECYLDKPVEDVLSALRHQTVCREKIFEVTSLASRAPHTVGSFLRKIVACGEGAGFEWAFFTATAPLKALLERLSLPLVPLGAADRSRVAQPEIWGTYYELEPSVYAVHRDSVGACIGDQPRMARYG
jgi:hypothetical protein